MSSYRRRELCQWKGWNTVTRNPSSSRTCRIAHKYLILYAKSTHEALIDLFIRVFNTTAAGTDDTEVTTTVTQLIKELLISASKLHVFFTVFWHLLTRIFAGNLRDSIEVEEAFALLGSVLLLSILTPGWLHYGVI